MTHTGAGSNATTLAFNDPTRDVSFAITNISQRTGGPGSRRYIELVTVSYVDGGGNTNTYGTYNGSNVNAATVNITGIVQSVTVSLTDAMDGDSGTSQMSIDLSTVDFCSTTSGGCPDADGDGICDAEDLCPDFDDNLIGTACDDNDACTINDIYDGSCNCVGTFQDSDNDGICDADETGGCTPTTSTFSSNPLTHSGVGSNTSSLIFSGTHQDISFSISNIGQKANGPGSRRYIELVTVNYVDEFGNTNVYGTYNGSSVSSAAVNISGIVQSVTIILEDAMDGDSGTSEMSISMTDVSSCEVLGFRSDENKKLENFTEVKLFPNPTSGFVFLEMNASDSPVTISVFDVFGKKIMDRSYPYSEQLNLDLNTYAQNSIFIVMVKIGEQAPKSFRIFKTE